MESNSIGEHRRRFHQAVARVVAELGGDRAAQQASAVGKATWYDTKKGRSIPTGQTWREMRAVLITFPRAVTQIDDWDELYDLIAPSAGQERRSAGVSRRAPAAAPPSSLPPGPAALTGRDLELTKLDELLLGKTSRTPPIAVVVGSPGIGKTALAVDWARRRTRCFPGGVLYADLQGWSPGRPAAADEILPGWLHTLGVEHASAPTQLDSRAALLRAALDGKRTLIVLDNVRDEEQVRPLLPGSPSCSVLMTSRQRLSGLAIHHSAEVVRLDTLATLDGIALMLATLGKAGAREAEHVAELATLCGGLPLALLIVAETAKARPGASLTSSITELADEHRRLSALHGEDARSDPRTVISWSYQQLRPEIAATFRKIGLFPGRELTVEALAALAEISAETASAHVRTLAGLNLVRNDNPGWIEIHDLIRLYAAEVAEHEEEPARIADARRRLFDYYLLSSHRADAEVEPLRYRVPVAETGSAERFDGQAAALAWFEAERANIVTLCAQDLADLDEERWKLAFLARGYFFRAKRIHEWILSHRHAVAAAVRSGDRQAEAMTRSNLGVALHENGDEEAALPEYKKAEELFEEVGDRHGISNTRSHRAAMLRRAGDFAGSLELSRQALDWYREAGNRRNVAITLRGIGLAELESGQPEAAEPALLESIALCAELRLDMDRARVGNTLGRLYLATGKYEEARQAFREAIAAGVVSGGVFEQAVATRGLGALAAAIGDTELAEAQWRAALRTFESLGSPKAADVRSDLAGLNGDRPHHSPD